MRKEDETGFIWYSSWSKKIKEYAKHDEVLAAKIHMAVSEYAETGEIVDTGDWQANVLLSVFIDDIDRQRLTQEDNEVKGRCGGLVTKYDTEKAEQMVLEGATTDEIMEEIGCSKRCAQYYRAKFSSENTENESDNDASAMQCNNNDASAMQCNNNDASAMQCNKCNKLDTDTEIDKDKDKDTEREKETLFTPTFAHEIFLLYQNLGLPLPKTGEVGFLQYDMKKGFENIRQQHLLPEDVIEAVKNYAKALSARDTWYHARLSFDRFTREDTISRFLPDRFDLKTYTNKQIILNDEYTGGSWI